VADVFLDTTLFIDFARGDTAADRIALDIESGQLTASCSTLTIAELWIGTMTRREELLYEALLMLLEKVPLSEAAAKQAGRWLRPLPHGQQEALFHDALIAASAQERGEPLVTRNLRDMRLFHPEAQGY